jgi:hypothetical protein
MSTVGEAELTLAARSELLRRLRIIQTGEGKYQVKVSLADREGELSVVTTRQPREWASLDRLLNHIQEKFGAFPAIFITLKPGETTK